MVSTTPKYSPFKNHNSHMIEVMAQHAPQTASALAGSRKEDRLLVQDDAFRCTKSVYHPHDLPVNTVAGIKGATAFGFEPYIVPQEDIKPRTLHFSSNRFVETCFTDQRAKAFQWVPAAKYVTHSDWRNQFPGRGKFGKYPKVTFTAQQLKDEKDKVGPHHYTTYDKRKNRSLGAFNL
jgi:hypothetical protein